MRTRQSLIAAALAILVIVTIWTADRLTAPDDLRFSFVYMFPLAAAAWWSSRRDALICATIAALAVVSNDLTLRPSPTVLANLWNEFTRTVTLFAMALLIVSFRASSERLRSHSEHAFRLATTDPLTGLYNRRYLDEQLVHIHATAARTRRPYALLALDLDGIKRINDSFGHAVGDDAIRSFADDLRVSIRAGDLAVRTGGDEFVVVLPEAETQDALSLAQRLRQRLHDNAGLRHAPSASAGVATWRLYTKVEELLAEADRLVYESKRAGGDRVSAAGVVQGG
jgi:diguanylate cyclase (GGDEF)-like protein